MENNSSLITRYSSLLKTAAILLLGVLLMEGWLYHVKPNPASADSSIQESLQQATDIYRQQHDQLLERSQELAKRLEAQLQAETPPQHLFRYLQQYPSFWGTTLFRDTTSIAWTGFSFTHYPDQLIPEPANLPGNTNLDVIKQNNVVSFLCRISFSVEDTSGTENFELKCAANRSEP